MTAPVGVERAEQTVPGDRLGETLKTAVRALLGTKKPLISLVANQRHHRSQGSSPNQDACRSDGSSPRIGGGTRSR